MAAKTQTERSKESKDNAKAKGQEELRHYVRPGTRAMLADLMAWHDVKEISEAVQYLIMNAHALGPEGSAPAMATPRHEITISENVARSLREAGQKQASRMDQQEGAR